MKSVAASRTIKTDAAAGMRRQGANPQAGQTGDRGATTSAHSSDAAVLPPSQTPPKKSAPSPASGPQSGEFQIISTQPAAPQGERDLSMTAALEALLRLEALSRSAKDLTELRHLIANESRKINRARQIFVIEVPAVGPCAVTAVSGVAAPDQRSHMIDAIAGTILSLRQDRSLQSTVEFTLPAYCDPDSDLANSYPFREMAWVPFHDRNKRVFAGLLMSRDGIWTDSDRAISERLAATFSHAWRELATTKHFQPVRKVPRYKLALTVVVLGALALPVPITALAPVEIVPRQPMIVSAPIDGVIDDIAVSPSSEVRKGDVLIRFSDTTLRNRLEVARREVTVAEARAKQANILSFSDMKGRHDLGIAQAELNLKRAELAYAGDLLERSVVRATRDGIAVYSDRRSLIGKPVTTGERIMEIANRRDVEALIELALPDAIALKADSDVKLFLDVDPLQPWSGHIVRADYRARPGEGETLRLRATAKIDGVDRPLPRIGLRGTAQIYGDRAPLAIVLFRRPISAMRQWLGV